MGDLEISDLVKSIAALILHAECDEDKSLMLGRLKEDVPEFYELVKEQLKKLESPESDPPDGKKEELPTGKFGVILANIEALASMLRKYGVWASLAILLMVSALLGYELHKSSRKYETLLQRLAQANPALAHRISDEPEEASAK